MLLSLPDDLWTVLWIASFLGSLGGFGFDVARPLARARGGDPLEFDNKVSLPHRLPGGVFDLGVLGPMLVGAVAAVACVFLFAVDDVGGGQSAVASLRDLLWISLVAGFGGVVVLETLRGALRSAIEENAKALVDGAVAEARARIDELVRRRVSAAVEAAAEASAGAAAASVAADEVAAEITELLDSTIGSATSGTRSRLRLGGRSMLLMAAAAAILTSVGAAAAWVDDDIRAPAGGRSPLGGAAVTPEPTGGKEGPLVATPIRSVRQLADLVLDVGPQGFTVRNDGTAAAPPFTVQLWGPFGDPVFEFPDGLQPAVSEYREHGQCLDGEESPPEAVVGAIADVFGVVKEIKESNNADREPVSQCPVEPPT